MEKVVKKELDTLLSLLGIEAGYDFKTEEVEDTTYFKASFTGENLGYLIGNHGKHLESLQYILSMMLRSKLPEGTKYRLILDVCGYKEEKSKKIERLALQKADDARILGEAVELEPMSPADRRVVHVALQVFDDIKTESVGEGLDRRVKIIPLSEKDIISSDKEEENEEEHEE